MFWRRKRNPADFAEEIRIHLQLEADELASEGVADPAGVARRAFGNITAVRERSYERGLVRWFEELRHDLRYASRTLRRSPAFTAGTALLLALGIGANTAVYSFVEAVLLRALPVPDPQSLVLLKWHARDDPKVKQGISGEAHREASLGYVSGNFPYPSFVQLSADRRHLSTLIGFFGGGEMTVLAQGGAARASVLFVSGEFFSGLRLTPALGRVLGPEDERATAPPAVVLSHAYWQSRFGGDSGAIGQTIHVNNAPFTIAGVAPQGFFGVDSANNVQIYVPVRFCQSLRTAFSGNANSMYLADRFYWIQMMGRLQPGVSRREAEAALAASFGGWVAGTAQTDAEKVNLPSLYLLEGATGIDFLRAYYARSLYVVVCMAALILAITCANIANLQWARATARRREIALRYGLGAGRWRVARQLLTEGVLLSMIGGALSTLFAWTGMRGLSALVSVWRPEVTLRAEMSWNCLIVSAVLTILTGMLFGLAPAVQASRLQLASGLKEVRTGAPPGRLRRLLPASGLRSGLVTVQIAICLMLVAGAFLFGRTLANLQSVRLGFQPENVFLFDVDARQAGYKGDAMGRLYGEIESRLRTIPGVRSASSSSYAMVTGSRSGSAVSVPGKASVPTAILWVGPDFFSTMQIPLSLGREFSQRDTSSSPMAVVVNEAFVAKHLPAGNPLGQTIRFLAPENSAAVVVGVARDTLLSSKRDKIEPIVFGAYTQHLFRISRMTFILRAASASIPLTRAVREAVDSADRRLPISTVFALDVEIRKTIGQERLFAFLGAVFAALALIIAAVGLYGTLAYSVSRRTGEIGIRMALGAGRGRVVSMVLRESLWMIAGGLAIGAPAVALSERLIGSFLYGTAPRDSSALVIPAAVMLSAALIAAGLPAWRAARIDPQTALRHE